MTHTVPSEHSDLGRWIARLRVPQDVSTGIDPNVDARVVAIDREALDSAVGFAAEHTRRYIASGGTDDGWDGPRPILILYTKGRRSDQWRRTPVLYFDHDDHRYIIGSKGGAPEAPQWLGNLLAAPEVYVRVMGDVYAAAASVAPPDERGRVWPALIERYPMFGDYQMTTDREIPLVRLDAT